MRYLLCSLWFASLGTSEAMAQPTGFFLAPRVGEVRDTSLYGLSANGRIAGGSTLVVQGSESSIVFSTFTPPGDLRFTVAPFTAPDIAARDISDDGSTTVGYAGFPDRPFNPEPAVASAAHGLEILGRPPGYDLGQAFGVSGDGNVVVGYGQRGPGGGEVLEAFRWTRAGGYQLLGRPRPESIYSQAYAASRDGSIIVGDGFTAFGTYDAFVWTEEEGMRILLSLPDSAFNSARARGISTDGTYIVGASANRHGFDHPVLWGPSGILDLGLAGPYLDSLANDVSNDGLAVAITLDNPAPGSGAPLFAAAVWTSSTGTMLLREYLLQHGISVPAGVTLKGSEAISADGRTIAGNAIYFDAELGRDVTVGFVATVNPAWCPADFNSDGGVDGSDVEAFFLAWESSNAAADLNGDGGVDGGDVEAFFVRWEAGGC